MIARAQPDRILSPPFVLAFAASFLSNLAFHAQVHLPGYLHRLRASELETGTIMAALAGAAVAIRPLAGRLMDARGRRVVALGGALLQLAGCALYLTVEAIGPWVYA
ncbi:MAG: MFS transporter, partial [Polyangiales bacterium]